MYSEHKLIFECNYFRVRARRRVGIYSTQVCVRGQTPAEKEEGSDTTY